MLLLLLRLVRVLGLLLVKDVPLVLLRRVSWLLVRHGDGRGCCGNISMPPSSPSRSVWLPCYRQSALSEESQVTQLSPRPARGGGEDEHEYLLRPISGRSRLATTLNESR